jgi:hypothetical protein
VDQHSLALLIPITAMLIPISAIVMGGILKLARLRLEEAKVRAGALPDGALAELDSFRGDVDQLRQELAEAQERLDFTERLLAQRRDQEKLPGGS